MKRLFFSVFALTLGAFAFMSCDDEGKINNEQENGKAAPGSFLTVPQQQDAIQGALNGVADAIQFTEFSNALNVVSGIMGRELTEEDLLSVLASPVFQTDSALQAKMIAVIMMMSKDTIVLDLAPFYMEANIFVKDTIRVDTTSYIDEGGGRGTRIDTIPQTILLLDSIINHDVNYLQVNVLVDEHKISLRADVKAGESIITIKDEKGKRSILLPKSAHITLTLDNDILAELNGDYQSDFVVYYEDVEEGDDIIKVVEGSKISIAGDLSIGNYKLAGSAAYDESKGIEGDMTLKYADDELLHAYANLNAVFEDLDITDTTAVLVWAQNPELLKSIALNASLAGGKVEFKGILSNPFKDEELATTLRSLMVPGATITEEKAKQTVEKLNAIIDAGFYFEGYKDAQAKLKIIYREAPEGEKGHSIIDQAGDLFDRAGAYPVLIAHDAEGNEIEVGFEEYFDSIDVKTFAQTIANKFKRVFGPIFENKNNPQMK